ncbi:MAG: ABC transporter substrate-binding protein, partial [Rubrivivax sp.]
MKGLPVARVALGAFVARMALAALGMLAGHPGTAAAAPVSVVDDRGVTVSLARPAQRVIALAPALTETVCALGACVRLVATDRHSNW